MADLSKKFGSPDFENKKFRLWAAKNRESLPGALIGINLDKERIYESRVYPLEGVLIQMSAKILAKQDLKTGVIEAALISEWKDKKEVHLTLHFRDENEYVQMVKKFEIFLATQFSIEPSKVLITSAQEYEKIIRKQLK